MKNTLKIGIKETTTEVLMYSSYDDGTNRLFVGLEASIAAHPWIQIGSSAKIYATSNDWRYEIEPTTWRGDSTFTITAGDDNNAGTVYTISQVPAAVTSNIGLEHTSGNTYRLTYTAALSGTPAILEDADGNVSTSLTIADNGITFENDRVKLGDYLPLAGGTMSGEISFANGSITENSNPSFLLAMDSFSSGGAVKWSKVGNITAGKASAIAGNASAVTVTAASGITIGSNASIKIGNIVTISLSIAPFTAAASWTNKSIGTVASGNRPRNIVITMASCGSWVGLIRIATDGIITAQTVAGGAVTTSYIGITATYVV